MKEKINESGINLNLVSQKLKKMGLSYEGFVKEIHRFSNGECSMSTTQMRNFTIGIKKIHVNPYTLFWILKFLKITPNDFFNHKD